MPKIESKLWKNKIVGHDRVPPESLTMNPLNFRRHPQRQRESLTAAIRDVGFIRSVTVNQTTGNLVDGHERVLQAIENKEPLIDVEYVKLTKMEERKALATMDAIGALAEIDSKSLDELLQTIKTDEEALQALFTAMATDAGLDYGQIGSQPESPDDFKEVDESIETKHECPKCGYRWSGGE